jgi:hypothetical protein
MRIKSLLVISSLFLGLLCLSIYADEPSSSDPDVHIALKGYEKTPTGYVFQLYFLDLPASQQPGLKRIGDPVGYKGFIVGPFSQNMFKTTVGDGPPTVVDASTLELDDPKTHHKVVLTYQAPAQAPQPPGQ